MLVVRHASVSSQAWQPVGQLINARYNLWSDRLYRDVVLSQVLI